MNPARYRYHDVLELIASGEDSNEPLDGITVSVKSWVSNEMVQACEILLHLDSEGCVKLIWHLIHAYAILSDMRPDEVADVFGDGIRTALAELEEGGTQWGEIATEAKRVIDQCLAAVEEARG